MNMEFIQRREAEEAEFPHRELTERIIGAAIEVHRVLGPGLLESVYQRAMEHELSLRELPFAAQRDIPVQYKGIVLGAALRLDLIVASRVIVEVKSAAAFEPIHGAQLLTYLKLVELKTGLLLNFNVVSMKSGIKRIVNPLLPSASSAPLR